MRTCTTPAGDIVPARWTHDEFGAFFDRHYRMVRAICRSVMYNDADHDDAIQDAFIDAWRHQNQFDPARGTERAWMSRIAIHRALKKLAKVKSRGIEGILPESLPLHAPDPSVKTDIGRLLLKLNDKQRRVIEKVFLEEQDPHDVAAEIGESYGNVRNHMYRGLNRLKELVRA